MGKVGGFLMMLVLRLLACFVATVCFAVVFGAPRKSLPLCGFVGTAGYLVYELAQSLGAGIAASVFFAATVVGISSEIMARLTRRPATVYITAGIFPLVPGASAYLGMLLFSQGKYHDALMAVSTVVYVACAISAGLAIGTLLRRR